MEKVPDAYGEFWNYLSQNQKDLILEGNYLMNEVLREHSYTFKDYSFLIFPFAKAFEGYLKRLFLDAGFISHLDYVSDHLRLGKMMSPHLVSNLGDRSLYKQIWLATTKDLADRVWETWKIGRNQIFHYFPHNTKGVSFEDAEKIINQIIQTMKDVHEQLHSKLKSTGKSAEVTAS